MEAMVASGSRLCQIIQGAGLQPRTAQRFQTVLATAGIVSLTDAGFASRMDDALSRGGGRRRWMHLFFLHCNQHCIASWP